MELEQKLTRMHSFEAIKFVLDGIELHDLQCIDVMKMLYSKKAIVSYTTGLGKTVLAAAVMRLLWNEDPSRKFIFLGKHDQLTQTPKKLESMCGRNVIATDASSDGLKRLEKDRFLEYSVLFLTHEALVKDNFMNTLFKNRSEYCGVFIDEAHGLCNVGYARSASVLAGMCRQFEYCYALTATPITTSVKQMAELAHTIDMKRFPDSCRLARDLTRGKFGIEEAPCFFINRDREEFGSKAQYRGIVEFVDPLPTQKIACGGNSLFAVCKGKGAYPQAHALVKLLLQRRKQKGLVYVNQHSVREWILPFLEEAGIRYECINGMTPMAKRAEIEQEFNTGNSLDVVITSVTTALDLDCDFVIFYEFTVDVKQMIGRAHRGLGDKVLDVIFVVTDDSGEIDYFYNNIFAISETIREILGKDYTELEQVDLELQKHA